MPRCRVEAVTVVGRDDGTNRRARLGLTYTAGSTCNGPATVFAKAADPAHKDMIRLTSGMFHEPRLFINEVALPLEHPVVYSAAIDEADYDFVMIMEDLTARGADPRDGTRPMTVEQVATGMHGLGRMHGKYWGEPCPARTRTGLARTVPDVGRHAVCAPAGGAGTTWRRRARGGPVADHRPADRFHLEALHQHANHLATDLAARRPAYRQYLSAAER